MQFADMLAFTSTLMIHLSFQQDLAVQLSKKWYKTVKNSISNSAKTGILLLGTKSVLGVMADFALELDGHFAKSKLTMMSTVLFYFF